MNPKDEVAFARSHLITVIYTDATCDNCDAKCADRESEREAQDTSCRAPPGDHQGNRIQSQSQNQSREPGTPNREPRRDQSRTAHPDELSEITAS